MSKHERLDLYTEPKVIAFGELEEGDVIEGPKGEPVVVAKGYDDHVPEEMYEIELEDGRTEQASGNHLWYVETDLDRSTHSVRVREGKVFRSLDEEIVLLLCELADYPVAEEMNLYQIAQTIGADDDHAMMNALTRIVESIGRVSEVNETSEHLDGEKKMATIPEYDSKRVAQQILALRGERRHRRRWPVIVGRVMTTKAIAEYPGTVHVPMR